MSPEPTLTNFTLPIPGRDSTINYTTQTVHAISLPEVLIVAAGFIFLAYWYIKVSKDQEKYKHWINPNGHEVNLYKIIRWGLFIYTGVIMLLGIIQILLAR